MRIFTLFFAFTGLLASGQGWVNNYDEPINFKCPTYQSISYITSKHSNYHEDRLWEFSCKQTISTGGSCHWSPYVNNFDKELTFECPPQFAIAGMASYHSNQHEDRRWKFLCCKGGCRSEISSICQWTSYVNWFDETFSWRVPHKHVLVGIGSYHQNYQEDRRWKYKYCFQQGCS